MSDWGIMLREWCDPFFYCLQVERLYGKVRIKLLRPIDYCVIF